MTFSRALTLTAAFMTVALGLGLSGCTPAPGGDTSNTSSIALATAADLVSFDVGELQGGQQNYYWQPVYDTLLRRAPDGALIANLATGWKFEDPLTFDLTLQPGVKFSDGSPLTATSVAQSMDRFRKGSGPDSAYLALVKSVEVKSDTNMSIHLSAPDPGLPYKLTSTSGAVENPAQFDSPDVKSVPAGSGPYVLDVANSTPGSSYTYTRNENYRDPSAYPYDTVRLTFLEDLTARVNALKSGQVDSAVLDGASAPEVQANGFAITRQSAAWEGLWLFDRDGKKAPALADARVRQAINMAIDRRGIVDGLQQGYGEPTNQIFKPGTDAYLPDQAGKYAYDPAAAKDLMAQAGYGDGFDLELPHSSGFEYLEPTLKDQLGAIGVRVTYDNIPGDQYITAVLRGDYAAAPFRYTQDSSWVDITRHITPDAQLNPFHTTTPALARLLNQAQAATDEQAQTAAYQAIATYVLDEAWFVPIDLNVQVVAHKSDIDVKTQVGQSVLPIWNYAPKS